MNREIRCKAWDIETKRMWQPDEIFGFTEKDILIKSATGVYAKPIEKVILLRYAGLHDRTGKEMYAADIIRRSDGAIGVLMWEEKEARFTIHAHAKPGNYEQTEEEVIGNIYQNPELLKEANDQG